MAVIAFDPTSFRARFPEFADPVIYPDAQVEAQWIGATVFVSDENVGDLTGTRREYCIQLATAHLMRLLKLIDEAGSASAVTGVLSSATIDKVSVTITPPPMRDMWDAWLAQSSYGQQLAATLKAQAVGGFYIGGNPERAAFRKVGGVF